jgi:hypothetical protein
MVLLVIDSAFFLLELITGVDYPTSSAAAISFANLNIFLQFRVRACHTVDGTISVTTRDGVLRYVHRP